MNFRSNSANSRGFYAALFSALAIIAVAAHSSLIQLDFTPEFGSSGGSARLLSDDEKRTLIGGDCNNHRVAPANCNVQAQNPLANCGGIQALCLAAGVFQCVEIRLNTHSECAEAEGFHCAVNQTGKKCAEHYSGVRHWGLGCLGQCTTFSFNCSNDDQMLGSEEPCSIIQ